MDAFLPDDLESFEEGVDLILLNEKADEEDVGFFGNGSRHGELMV